VEIGLEALGAKVEGRQPRFRGNGLRGLREFLYPAHITSLAMNMLLYVNDRLAVMLFGVVIAVGAKWVLRTRGSMLNGKLTGRMPLVLAWLTVFALQAIVRGLIFDTSIPGALAPMTGVAFVLYSNYMITDPGTSPSKPKVQMVFGGGVAALYAFFMIVHIAYGLFFATAAVCLIRGGFLWGLHFVNKFAEQRLAQERKAAAAAAPLPLVKDSDAGKEVVPA
jgi:hypothetical protein